MKCENCGEDISEEQYLNFNHKCPACNRANKNFGFVFFKNSLIEIYRDLNSKDKIVGLIALTIFVTFIIAINSIFG